MEQLVLSRFFSGGGGVSRVQCLWYIASAVVLAACAGEKFSEFEPNPDVDELALPLPIEGQCDTSCCSSCCPASPIIVDLAGDGLSLTSASDGVEFDVTPGDSPEAVSWTRPGSDDAWLVLDRNENDLIDDGSELFGNFTDQEEPIAGAFANGYAALALLDRIVRRSTRMRDPLSADVRMTSSW